MIFVKASNEEKSYNIAALVPKSRWTEGDIGIEIEVEGKKLPKEDHVTLPWTYHHDGSLRGHDNAEYVLGKPLKFSETDKALDGLWDLFRQRSSVLDESNRTSVHIHLNVQEFFLDRLTSLMSMYFTFEEIFTAWCGEHRVGNLFCLRAKDAPAIVSQIRRFIRSNMETPLKDNLHYAGMNANAIHKFGSLEFRSLRGVSDPTVIKEWIAILRRLYDLSASMFDPREVCGMFSQMGPLGFFNEILGPMAETVRSGVGMSDDEISHSMYEGIRMAQDLAYARDWSEYKGVKFVPDPFNRDKKKPMPGGLTDSMLLQELMAHNAGQGAQVTVDTGWATGQVNVFAATPPPLHFHDEYQEHEMPDLPDWDEEGAGN